MKDNFVYVIAIGGEGGELSRPVKIGVTHNPAARLETIRSNSPVGLSYVCLYRAPSRGAAFDLERMVHRAVQRFRLDYEWFDLDPNTAADLVNEYARRSR